MDNRCECCGSEVNLQMCDGFLLCRYAASEFYHDCIYPIINGISMKPYTYDREPYFPGRERSIFLAGPSSDAKWRPTAIRLLRVGGFRGTIIIPEFHSGIFDKSLFDDGKPSTIPNMSRSSERIMEWETNGIDNATVLMVWMPYTGFDDVRRWTGLSTRSEASRAIATHSGRRKLVLGMPKDAFRSGQERYHAHINGVPIYESLEDTCSTALSILKSYDSTVLL